MKKGTLKTLALLLLVLAVATFVLTYFGHRFMGGMCAGFAGALLLTGSIGYAQFRRAEKAQVEWLRGIFDEKKD